MNTSRHALALLAGVALIAVTACGGLVVFVEDDGDGGSNAGANGPGPGPGPDTSSNDSSSSTGIPATVCEQFCAVWSNCQAPGCVSQCEEYVGGECATQGTAYFSCLAGSPNNGCPGLDEICEEQYVAFANCFGPLPNCFTQDCDESEDGFCNCAGVCGGAAFLQQFCELGSCECYLDDNFIGSCQSSGQCSIEENCCQQLAANFN